VRDAEAVWLIALAALGAMLRTLPAASATARYKPE
jgi:hypothetical protein